MQKEYKKNKYLVSSFIISLLVFIVLINLFILYFLPNFQNIENSKKEVISIVNEYNDIKRKWLSYEDFIKLKTNSGNISNPYLDSIIKSIDKKFYDTNLVNKWWWDYDQFITNKNKIIKEKLSDENFKTKLEMFKKVLPSYVETWFDSESWHMSDFKFLTYIESIIQTFNLKSLNNEITLWNLNILKEYDTNDKGVQNSVKNVWLDATIFYIPYKFNVSWTKKDILDFLYFLENVATVKLDETTNSITLKRDTRILKELNWFKNSNSNIFENPIIEIQNFNMKNYIDSYVESADETKDFIEYINSTQWFETIEIEVSVRFYVKWLPNYEITETLNEVNKTHKKVKNLLFDNLNKYKLWTQTIVKTRKIKWLEDLNKSLIEMEKNILKFNKQKTSLYDSYEKILELKKKLEYINSEVNWIINKT